MVGRTPVGETAELEVLRGGEEIELQVEIGRLPEEGSQQAAVPSGDSGGPASAPLGMMVEPLPADMADSMGVEGGVVVNNVARGAASEAGIRAGDVITEINRQKVTSVQEFREAVRSLPEGKAVSVRVVRQGRALYLVMKP